MHNFRNIDIWSEGIELVKRIYAMAEELPVEEKFGLKSQICRAAVSIPSNIAEGCSRSTQADFKRFLEIAMGSAFECETQLVLAKELNLLDPKVIDPILQLLQIEQKKINSLISKLKT